MDKTIAFIFSIAVAFLIGGACGFWVVRQMVLHPDPDTARTDTVYRTEHVEVPRYYPVPELIVMPPFPAVIDTPAVIAAFYATKFYRDTLVNNEQITAVLEDSVTENSITDRRFTFDLRYPEITKTVTRKPVVQAGIFVDTRASAGIQAGYKSVFLQAGYSLRDKEPFVGIGFKFFER